MNDGFRFGKYTVLSRIGTGGMAEVFKCRRDGIGGFDKIVVVKRILPDLVHEPEIVTMFLDEARLAANLSHPNIIQIYEIDEADGLPYIAMEYVKGPTFRSMLGMQKRARQPPDIGVAVKVMAGICAALQYVHTTKDSAGNPMGLIHRDVSPANILVSTEGVPKLLDFGVAKALSKASVTRAGTVKGKLKFMPPEQLRQDAPIDHRLDIFSAGVCLYQGTTGRLPYNGDDEVAIMMAAAKGEFLAPSAIVPGYPAELEELVLWAMNPDVSLRCGDAGALGEALERFVGSGRWHTTTRSLKEHIALLFPTMEDDSRVAIEAYSLASHTPSLSSFNPSKATATPNPSSPRPPAQPAPLLGPEPETKEGPKARPSRRVPFLAAGAIVGVALLIGLGWGFFGAKVPPKVAVPIAPPSEAEGDDEGAAHVALAERLVTDGKREMAREALALARKSKLTEALEVRAKALDARLAEVPIVAVAEDPPAEDPPTPAAPTKPKPGKAPAPKKGKKGVKVAAVTPPPEPAKPEPSKATEPAKPTEPVKSAEPVKPAPVEAPKPEPVRPAPVVAAAPADDFGCKEDTVAKGAGPPRGMFRWCELPDGTKHGRAVRWYPNGVKAEEGEYKNGKKNGRWIEYFESGLERERSDWRRGVKSW